MAAKKNVSKKKIQSKEPKPAWQNIILSLTLVPLVIGVLLIIAWAADWDWVGSLENQIYIGILFLLFSFSISNLVQRRWLLFAGWALLLMADLIFLLVIERTAQIFAGVIGLAGILIISYHFFRQIGQNSASR